MSRTGTTIRWGILGTGRIANTFATALAELPDAELVAVGSRTQESAQQFADKYGAPHRHGSYQALANDPDVDAVYVATPHPLHRENSVLCLGTGKAVLCEKPFAINAGEAEGVIAFARQRGVFLMEAMWPRFLPLWVTVRQLLADGAIGEVRMLAADFGFRTAPNPQHRLLDPALGGGALLDVGVYVISLASMIFGGAPSQVTGLAHLGETGVDEQSAMVLGYEGGRLALLAAAVRTRTPVEATIMGTDGLIRIHPRWYTPTGLTLSRPGQPDEEIEAPIAGNGYGYEAIEVGRCLREGLTESATMPLDETLAIVRTMDRLRAQWGLHYPMERASGRTIE